MSQTARIRYRTDPVTRVTTETWPQRASVKAEPDFDTIRKGMYLQNYPSNITNVSHTPDRASW